MTAGRFLIARAIVVLTLTSAVACGGGGDSTEPNDPVASVTISPAASQIASLGETVQLTAAVRTQGGANANATVTWQSSAPQIATVDANGLVRAVANGIAQITATTGTVSGTADITVQQVAMRVSVTPTSDSMFAGATLQLTATASDRSNAAIASPRAAWTSNDTSIAVVSSTGLVTGRKRGQARITVRVDTASASTDVTVRLTSILASRDTVIGGALQVDRFEVAAGRTVTLAGDLTLRAEGPVVINGTIRGDCREVDIVTSSTVLVRGSVDNTCSDATAAGKRLRLVSGAAYTLDSARVFSTGETYITNDTTIVVDTTSLGSSSFASRRALRRAPANCSISGTVGQGFKHAGAASGSPFGGIGTHATAHMNIQCSGDLALLSATFRASSGGDGGTGTTTTVGQTARGGGGGFGAHILLYAPRLITVAGSSFFGGNGGDGGAASSQPSQPGLASAVGADGGVPGGVFFTSLRTEFVGSPSRIGIGRGGRGGDGFAFAVDGAHATTAADAQQGSEARARGGAGASSRYPTVLGALMRGQVQNAGNLTISGPVAGTGGDAAASPGNGGSSALVPRPHGGPGGNGEVQPGSGGDVMLMDNRGGGPIPVGTPGGTGNGTVRRGNGGVGVPDCVLPFHLGGNGGAGGKVDNLSSLAGADASGKRSLSVGKVEVIDALNGRDGRDGVPPGGGGTAGVLVRGTGSPLPDVDVGVSRRAGVPGLSCPPVTATNPICDAQLTPQANVIHQISQSVFAGNPNAFCANATSNVFTGPVVHTVPSIAPNAQVINQTSFRMVPPKDRVLNHTSFNIIGGGTYPLTAATADAFNTNYPCGQHANGRTHCVLTTPLTAGPYVVVFGIMNGNIPQADPANLYQYGFVFDRDNNPSNNYVPPPQFANDFFKGTDLWYFADYNPRSAGFNFGARRVVNNASQPFSTNARLILSGATWFLIVPASEFSVPDPMVRFTAFRHTGNFGLTGDWDGDVQRPVDQPLWKLPIQPNSSPTMRIRAPSGLGR